MTEYKKKLIEVALPLEAINRASAREKSIRHGHPSTLHLWWARRPLAACRAVLFASLVDDPSAHPDQFPTDEAQEAERQRLFRIIEELVKWENSTNETILESARVEIMQSTDGDPPPILDPFCGGGSISLEAERLGLESHASDLNPVAVLITKALIEIPPKFAGLPPVNPEAQAKFNNNGWRGAQGLAEDVRHYGHWMRTEAERRIGHLYPKVVLPKEYGGAEATVVAWLWARVVRCPNPACGAEMPLVRSFAVSTKKGKQAWVEPIVDASAKSVRFEVREGSGVARPGTVGKRGAECLVCGLPAPLTYIRSEGAAGRMSSRLLAIVAEGTRSRVYCSPEETHEALALAAQPPWRPEGELSPHPQYMGTCRYGLTRFADLFTSRQLTALATFSDLVQGAREKVLDDAAQVCGAGERGDCDRGAVEYADAVATYLAFALSKMADRGSTICTWFTERDSTRNTFARQAIPMTWDYAELNTLLTGTGSFEGAVSWTAESLASLGIGRGSGTARQLDATAGIRASVAPLVSTDPPYYDNVPYADLSDYFYVWLRSSLRSLYPDLFSTLLTPKSQELVADSRRHEGRLKAKRFFEQGLLGFFESVKQKADPRFPFTLYYAFKQAETAYEGSDGTQVATASSGWETLLESLLSAGFAVVGTWPMRSELSNRMRSLDSNALASSIVLVCRPRSNTAPLATRREFREALKSELAPSLRILQRENIAPVDLAQASIGPGMAVFSRYAKVMEADGSQMGVRTALALINQALDEILTEQEGEFDADTRWAIAWFEQFGIYAGEFGTAETLSKAKGTSVDGMVQAGVLEAKSGKVRLLRCDELDEEWDPATDKRLTVWEMTHHLIRQLDEGETAAATLARQLGSFAEVARDLAYRLYVVCERKKWSREGRAYNGLVIAWPQIQRLAATESASAGPSQTSFEV